MQLINYGIEEPIKNKDELKHLNIFNEYLDKMLDLYQNKNHDYGDSVTKTFEEYGLTAFLVRMDDKMNRLKTLNKSDDTFFTFLISLVSFFTSLHLQLGALKLPL